MKAKDLDTIVIVDEKPMWKKDWEKQEKENENTQEYYCAVVLPTRHDWTGNYREGYKVYVVKVKWNGKPTRNTFLPVGVVMGEADFADLSGMNGENIYNGIINRVSLRFIITNDLDGDEIVNKLLYVDDSNFIDIYKTFEKVNALETAIKYEVVEELYAQEFQEAKSSKERNEWLDEKGANEGTWMDYVEEDIQMYIDKLNENLEKIKKTKKRKTIKEYKLVEVSK